MILFKTALDLSNHLSILSARGLKTGFVPTMGALHQGHLSLIAASIQRTDITICSIFINPTQFNDPADFEKYPITIENDILLLEKSGCDILFLPSVNEMYPAGTTSLKQFKLGELDTILEGSHRPGHFQGVCQVVYRLLDIVKPAQLFLGQKDFQQCMVIKLLIQQSGWNIGLTIVPICREKTGLAMSSRNTRLSADNKYKAAVIYKALSYLQANITKGNTAGIKASVEKMLLDNGFDTIDYISVADANTLEAVTEWDDQTPIIALVAAFIQGVRLIDNMIIPIPVRGHEK
jgi:pantoate--beta-alanine ligase